MDQRFLTLLWCLTIWQKTHANPVSFHSSEQYYRSSSEKDVEQLKQNIVNDLGLSRLPNLENVNTSPEELDRMLEIYRRSVEGNDQEDEVTEAPELSVQRFHSFKDNASKTGIDDNYLLVFPINTGDQSGVSLHSAKLYLFKKKKPVRWLWTNQLGTATIKLYQLMEPFNRRSEKLLIEEKNIVFNDDWEVFDVKRTVATWIEKPISNYGFQIVCEDCSYQELRIITADTMKDEESDQRAKLDILIMESASRSKRSRGLSRPNKSQPSLIDCTQGSENKLCCRYSMWVSFKEIGWDWILQPESFEAYFCKGKCPHDYSNYASTHALIQSIFNYHKDDKIPEPCCVPRRLKSLSLLHYNDKDPPELIVTRQTGMIAQECACS